MATSIGFTSSQVFVMLSVATCFMLVAAAPVGTDRSGCNRTMGGEIHNNLTTIVSYTLLLVNITKLCTISAYYELLVHSGNSIMRTFRIILYTTCNILNYADASHCWQ